MFPRFQPEKVFDLFGRFESVGPWRDRLETNSAHVIGDMAGTLRFHSRWETLWPWKNLFKAAMFPRFQPEKVCDFLGALSWPAMKNKLPKKVGFEIDLKSTAGMWLETWRVFSDSIVVGKWPTHLVSTDDHDDCKQNFEGVTRLGCLLAEIFFSFFLCQNLADQTGSCLARVTRSCSFGSCRVVFWHTHSAYMSFPSQCIIHVFKLHVFFSRLLSQKACIFWYVPCKMRALMALILSTNPVFSHECVDQHQSQLSQDLCNANHLRHHNCWVVGIDLSNSLVVSLNWDGIWRSWSWKTKRSWKMLETGDLTAIGKSFRCCGERASPAYESKDFPPKTSRSAIPPIFDGKKTQVLGMSGAFPSIFD